MLCNVVSFDAEKLLALCPASMLEDNPMLAVLAVHDCLVNIFAAAVHIGCHSSIHNLRFHHAMVTGTHLSLNLRQITVKVT
jgi:hypothetical protein